ncbi:MAG: DUF1564 family protein [Leptospiraceae bacterium]|nr:DUF1564 family protein [Leptospiraceae bacterium]
MRTSSTFLLTPDSWIKLNVVLRKRNLSLPGYLEYLTARYADEIRDGLLNPVRKAKRLYQPPSCNYRARNFTPRNDVWVAFSQLASFLNWARCVLFVALLDIDYYLLKTEAKTAGVHVQFRMRSGHILRYIESLANRGWIWAREIWGMGTGRRAKRGLYYQ